MCATCRDFGFLLLFCFLGFYPMCTRRHTTTCRLPMPPAPPPLHIVHWGTTSSFPAIPLLIFESNCIFAPLSAFPTPPRAYDAYTTLASRTVRLNLRRDFAFITAGITRLYLTHYSLFILLHLYLSIYLSTYLSPNLSIYRSALEPICPFRFEPTMSRLSSPVPLVLLLLVTLTLTHLADAERPYYCVLCVSKGKACSRSLARTCNICNSYTAPVNQPKACRNRVCKWCSRVRIASARALCNDSHVRAVCGGGGGGGAPHRGDDYGRTKTPPTKASTAPAGGGGKCTWTATGSHAVVNLGAVKPGQGWSRVSRHGFSGIAYETSKKGGIDPPGKYGEMCFDMRVKSAGNYYFGAVSYAPHNTEHNDVWVRSSKGFWIWKKGNLWKKGRSDEWFKAYQNYGSRGIAEDFKTKDHDGHRFLIQNLKANEKLTICISGRSYRYELYRLVLAKCSGMTCKGRMMPDIKNFKPSVCK